MKTSVAVSLEKEACTRGWLSLRREERILTCLAAGFIGLFVLSFPIYALDNANMFPSFWHAVRTVYIAGFFIMDIYIAIVWLGGKR